jgi:ParB-like chromosome segregation protein Spo0J
VKKAHGQSFEIICGARRYRAAKRPAWPRAGDRPRVHRRAGARDHGDRERPARDVPPLEEAAGYKQLLLIDKTYTPR